MSAVLRARSRDFLSNGTASYLVISPHPDDETFGCGGTLAILAGSKRPVCIVFLTDGSASHPDHPALMPSVLAAIRRKEAARSMSILGIPNDCLTFLNAPDGKLASLPEERAAEIVRAISSKICESMADAVFVPCSGDGSSEHVAAFALAQRAVAQAGRPTRILEYPVWSWWSPRLLLRNTASYPKVWRTALGTARSAKVAAILQYSSQIEPVAPEEHPSLPPGFAAAFDRSDEIFFER